FGLSQIQAQEYDVILVAFNQSYEAEYFQNYTEAIQQMDKIYISQSYEINLRLGWLHYQNASYTKSESYYSKSVLLKPKSIEAKLGLANAYGALGSTDKLIILYEDILKLDSKNSTANYRLAYILHSQRQMTKALEYITKVLVNYPFDFDSNVLAGKIYISLGDITKAREVLQTAQIYNPKSIEISSLLKGL
ncbi:MAG: tetratricopeptide repeat protein, partial [Salinivirgaceae bacterium]|nr:tetratricopeptide repeat protein [Salinivirgaceae bacterium]